MKIITVAAALAAVVSTPALAQEGPVQGKDGIRIEGQVAWERLNDPELDQGINYELGSGISYGGEIGFAPTVHPVHQLARAKRLGPDRGHESLELGPR